MKSLRAKNLRDIKIACERGEQGSYIYLVGTCAIEASISFLTTINTKANQTLHDKMYTIKSHIKWVRTCTIRIFLQFGTLLRRQPSLLKSMFRIANLFIFYQSPCNIMQTCTIKKYCCCDMWEVVLPSQKNELENEWRQCGCSST